MARRSKLNPPSYQFGWQCLYALHAKQNGPKAANSARRYISITRLMDRYTARGLKTSILDFPDFGPDPYRFILKRNSRFIRRAVRMGKTEQEMRRRGLFDPLKDHSKFRGFSSRGHKSRAKA